MSGAASELDPTKVADLNAATASWAAAGETVKPIEIDQVIVEEHALDALAELARSMTVGQPTLMVVDQTPMRRGGEDLKAMVCDTLSGLGPIVLLTLPQGSSKPFAATLDAATTLAKRLPQCGLVVAVGSGSITDVVKYARHLDAEARGKTIPFISFPTAASVTAYTSALAVLKVDGVKRTLVSRPPDAVVCDLHTLVDAPLALVLAGFGDVLARSVSYGDWYLAWQLGMDDGFSEIPGRLLAGAEQAMIDRAEDVAHRQVAGVRAVVDALLLAGMAMSVVNQTAPVSGWEHVISHYLDMTAAYDGRVPALHGAQVGAGTLVSAYAYERAWTDLDLDRLEAASSASDINKDHERIHNLFSEYDPSGKMAAEVLRDYQKKAQRWQQSLAARRTFVSRKRSGEHDAYLRDNVRPASDVAHALARATAPLLFAHLDQPIPDERVLTAIRQAHLIRSRFTLGDLLDKAGWLTEENVSALLDATTT